MDIGGNYPLGSQPVHVRRSGLRVTLKRIRPVIQIVDGDEQYVGPLFSLYVCIRFRRTKQQNGYGEDHHSFHWRVISLTVCPRRIRPVIGISIQRRGISDGLRV